MFIFFSLYVAVDSGQLDWFELTYLLPRDFYPLCLISFPLSVNECMNVTDIIRCAHEKGNVARTKVMLCLISLPQIFAKL